MTDGSDGYSIEDAERMLDLFASLGVVAFDQTLTDRHGEKKQFRRGARLAELRTRIPALLSDATRQEQNVILRPLPPPVFLQLDDLRLEAVERVKPAAFLAIETSPANYQAWIALSEDPGAPFVRRLRRGVDADLNASGATRLAGSLNFKDKYAPVFPRVTITHARPGCIVTPDDITALDLLAPPEIRPRLNVPRKSFRPESRRRWPSYEKCLESAPANRDGSGPDTSRVDFTWCMIAIDWHWTVEATAERLMEESAKARENGMNYALRTAQRAAEAVAHNRSHRP